MHPSQYDELFQATALRKQQALEHELVNGTNQTRSQPTHATIHHSSPATTQPHTNHPHPHGSAHAAHPPSPSTTVSSHRPHDGTWSRMKAWWKGTPTTTTNTTQLHPPSTAAPNPQTRSPVRSIHPSNQSTSPTGHHVATSPPPQRSSPATRRMHMSFLGSTSSAALRASMTPPSGYMTPPKSTNSNLAGAVKEQPQPGSSSMPVMPKPVHASSPLSSVASTPMTPPRHDTTLDENPILIGGSPWWRHQQKDVDAAVKAQHQSLSPGASMNMRSPIALAAMTEISSGLSIERQPTPDSVLSPTLLHGHEPAPTPGRAAAISIIRQRDIFGIGALSHSTSAANPTVASTSTLSSASTAASSSSSSSATTQVTSPVHGTAAVTTTAVASTLPASPAMRGPSRRSSIGSSASLVIDPAVTTSTSNAAGLAATVQSQTGFSLLHTQAHSLASMLPPTIPLTHPSLTSGSGHSSVHHPYLHQSQHHHLSVPKAPAPTHDSTEQLKKSHIVRDVRQVDGAYKRKLRKEQDQLSAPTSNSSLTMNGRSSPLPSTTSITAAIGILRTPTNIGRSSSAHQEDDHSYDPAFPSFSPSPSSWVDRSSSPTQSHAVHVLLQPSGSEKFWYSVVLATWPKMLHSSLLHKMIDRDGIPPYLRHKVWTEILAGSHGSSSGGMGKRKRSVKNLVHLTSSSPSNSHHSSSPQFHSSAGMSSMQSDIRRMQSEPTRSNLSTPSSSLVSTTPPIMIETQSNLSTAASSASHPQALYPIDRCPFCSGVGDIDLHTTCTCPDSGNILFIPLTRPSSGALQMVLEGFVLQRELQEKSHDRRMSEDDLELDDSIESPPTSGYVQGMSYLAEVFLCSMPPALAIACLIGLFEQRFFRSYLAMRVDEISIRFTHFETTLQLNAPSLANYFKHCSLPADCYYLEFLATLCAKQLPPEWIARIWDGYMLYGELYILRCTVALLQLLQPMLLKLGVSQLVRALREPMTLGVFVVSSPTTPALPSATTTIATPSTITSTGTHSSRSNTPMSSVVDSPVVSPTATQLIAPRAVFAPRALPIDPPSTTATPIPISPTPNLLTSTTTHDDDDEVSAAVAGLNLPTTPSIPTPRSSSTLPPPSFPQPSPSLSHTRQDSKTSSSAATASTTPTSSFWWWPFSSSSKAAQTNSGNTTGSLDYHQHQGPSSGPTPHVSITLSDLLIGIQQVELPPQVIEYGRPLYISKSIGNES